MDVEQLKQDVAEGKVSLDRLVDLIVSQQKLIEKLQKQITELQEKLASKNPTERVDEPYSEKAEEKRQAKGKKNASGASLDERGESPPPKKSPKQSERSRSFRRKSIPNNASSRTPESSGGSKTVGPC